MTSSGKEPHLPLRLEKGDKVLLLSFIIIAAVAEVCAMDFKIVDDQRGCQYDATCWNFCLFFLTSSSVSSGTNDAWFPAALSCVDSLMSNQG